MHRIFNATRWAVWATIALGLAMIWGAVIAQTVSKGETRWSAYDGTKIIKAGMWTSEECEKYLRAEMSAKRLQYKKYSCEGRFALTGTPATPVPPVVTPPAPPVVIAPTPDPTPPAPPTTNPPVTEMPPGIGLPLTAGFSTGSPGPRVQPTSEVAPRSGDGTGNFRTNCEPTHMAYDDPIVFPGQPGRSHLHTFFGNTGVNARSTTLSITTTGNSSCRGGTLNRSAYWVPSMVDTRTNRAVMPRGSNFYYKTGYDGVRPADIRPFPAGLRMIAGDPKNTGPGDIYGGNAWRYHCFAAGNGHGTRIPNCNVGDDMVQEIYFPQCWDGVNLDSPDHKSHMAYANGRNPGCPRSHPVPVPQITFNIFYRVTESNQTTNWRLSSDNYSGPAGYSAHGDWWNGWQQEAMETFVRTCNNMALDCHSHLLGDGRMIF